MLADFYGPQRLLAEGLVPPALVFANPNFLRPCRSAAHPPGHPLLHTYAADLIRGPDGQWRVLADRTSRAAGIGHAQENRRMLGRVLPNLFRGQPVQPLRPFFDHWQDSLQRLAPPKALHGSDNAAVALLTPGVGHPLWFEHVLLASELSCALVEPGDLTVRGGALFLKTLKGLQPIDVLLRRVDGRHLDPLEFGGPASDGGGGGGVPGLLDAMRSGAVRIVNAPGCGMVEAPALGPLLPALAERLLGERLALPAIESHWLARPGALELLRRAPADWVIRPAFDGTVAGQELAALPDEAFAALMARIAARPQDHVASRATAASVAPCAGPEGLSPRPVVLRLFLVQENGRWRAMPGGLARSPEPGESLGGRLPRQGLAKDVWVLGEDGASITGPAALPLPPLPIRRAAGALPSRVADNLFWLGRYVERLEGAARLMRAVLGRLDRGPLMPRELAELAALAAVLRHAGLVEAEDIPNGAAHAALQAALGRALRDGGSLARVMAEIARLVESVRDRMTGDMHTLFLQPLRAIQLQAAAAPGRDGGGRDGAGLEEALGGILRYCAGVAGVAAENMVRAGGYAFLDLGRRVERGQAIAAQLGFALDQPASRIEGGLRLALELCDSVITYRSRYLGVLQPAPALDLVLADPGNPRGLGYQLAALRRRLTDLEGGAEAGLLPAVDAMIARVEAIPSGLLAAADQAQAAARLAPRIAALEGEMAAISDAITRRFFALLPAIQTLGQAPSQLPETGAGETPPGPPALLARGAA
jgi:uncharacterized circularly permuted ATP-grasp superfamily protein/uncharacterized alpha-E superfamily protein